MSKSSYPKSFFRHDKGRNVAAKAFRPNNATGRRRLVNPLYSEWKDLEESLVGHNLLLETWERPNVQAMLNGAERVVLDENPKHITLYVDLELVGNVIVPVLCIRASATSLVGLHTEIIAPKMQTLSHRIKFIYDKMMEGA